MCAHPTTAAARGERERSSISHTKNTHNPSPLSFFSPGTLDYQEFLAATLHQSQLDKEDNMVRAFAAFDVDGDGSITKEELVKGLAAAGITGDEIDGIVAEADTDGDGLIDYDEFCVMMRGKAKAAAPVPRKGSQYAA